MLAPWLSRRRAENLVRRMRMCLACAALASATTGCTELMLAPHRDDAFLSDHRYALGEQYLTTNGLRVCYQEAGEGDTVIILPGLATSIDFWQLTLPALAQQHHVVAVDPPGFGKSDKPAATYDLPWICDHIVSFMDAKRIGRATFIGGSLGGQLAMLIALEHPERVDGLVLMGSSGAWRPPGVLLTGALRMLWNDAIVVDHLRRTWPHTFAMLFLHDGPVIQSLFHYQMSLRANLRQYWPEGQAASRAMRSIFFHSCLDRLPDLHQPVLLIWGEQDQFHLRSEALTLRAGLPDSRLVVVPDAAHEVMLDQPEVFNRLVLSFLAAGTSGIEDAIPAAKGVAR